MGDFDPDASRVDVSLTRASDARSARRLQREAASGRLVRIRAGAFADAEEWTKAASIERYHSRIRAVASTRARRPVLTHESAAAIWGIPKLGRWPEQVHLVDVAGSRPRSRNGVVWHQATVEASEIVEVDEFLVTGLTRTLLDLARTMSFASAVVSLDHGVGRHLVLPSGRRVRGTNRPALVDRLESLASMRGTRAARSAIEFCDPASGSPGESLSRARMHLLGFPPPHLQVRMPSADGRNDIVDFDWPEFGLFGEFDGRGKYLRDVYTRGRSIADIVMDEKEREDRIRRRHRPYAVRWDWPIALDGPRLAIRLHEAGLPRAAPRAR